MSERDDIDDLLDDLAETLEALQRELPAGELAPRPPRPRRRRPRRARDDRSGDTEPPRKDETSREGDRTGDRDRVRDSDRVLDRTRRRERNQNRGRSRRRRGPGSGAGPRRPRIPSPGEFLRFTEEYTIPTLIAMLEATVRSLELLRAVLRVAGGRGLPDPTGSGRSRRSRRSRGREVVGDAGRRALDSLDTVLDDLQDAVEGQPTDPRARDLLGEARDLRAEIDDMIAGRSPVGDADDTAESADAPNRDDGDAASRSGTGDRRSGGVTIDVGDSSSRTAVDAVSTADRDEDDGAAGSDDGAGDDGADVDVDAELDTIKREMGKTAGTAEGETGDGGETGDADEDGDGDEDGDDGARTEGQ